MSALARSRNGSTRPMLNRSETQRVNDAMLVGIGAFMAAFGDQKFYALLE